MNRVLFCRGIAAVALALLCMCPAHVAAQPIDDAWATPEPWFGPMPSWRNVMTDYGAMGDGEADDTAAFQRALGELGRPGQPNVLYLPPGRYRITQQLDAVGVYGLWLIGEDPASTRLIWDGAEGEDMLWLNGRDGRIARITFDGRRRAAAGIAYQWHRRDKNSPQSPSTAWHIADCVFTDLRFGMDAGGKLGWLDSEVLYERCTFIRCTEAGIGLRHFNAVNHFVRDCHFIECGVGVSNLPEPQGGVFHVSHSVFERSERADMAIKHTGYFGIRNNLSIGSKRFFEAVDFGPNGAPITFADNLVIDSVEPDAFKLSTMGPLTLVGNTVSRRDGNDAPAVVAAIDPQPQQNPHRARVQLLAWGNRFTTAQPFVVQGSLVERNTQRIDPVAAPPSPQRPRASPRVETKVFAVAPGAGASRIQQAIDDAAAALREDPTTPALVHLPHGEYALAHPLVIPAGLPIILAGDGAYRYPDGIRGTVLRQAVEMDWPLIKLAGPSRATVRDLAVLAMEPATSNDQPPTPYLGTTILVNRADQPGGRVRLRMCQLGATRGAGLFVEGLNHTRVQAVAHQGGGLDRWPEKWGEAHRDDPWSPYPAVRVHAHAPDAARVELLGGNCGRYHLTGHGRLLVLDNWYESNWARFYSRLAEHAQFTVNGVQDMSFTQREPPAGVPHYRLEPGFAGRLNVIGTLGNYRQENPIYSFAGQNDGPTINLLGIICASGNYMPDRGMSPVMPMTHLHARHNQSLFPDHEQPNEAAIEAALREVRPAVLPQAAPPDATDLQLIRVHTANARVGVRITGPPAGMAHGNSRSPESRNP